MESRYMVVQFGHKKETKEPYSIAYKVIGDEKGTYGRLNENDRYFTKDIRPIGTMIKVSMKEI